MNRTILAVLLAVFVVGCGGGGTQSGSSITFVETTLVIGVNGGTLSADGVNVMLPPDATRVEGPVTLRVRSKPYIKSTANPTFDKGAQVIASLDQIASEGFTVTFPDVEFDGFEDWFVAFGQGNDIGSDVVQAERVSSTHSKVHITSDQFQRFSDPLNRSSELEIRISVALVKILGEPSKLLKPTFSVFDPDKRLQSLDPDDSLAGKKTAIVIHGLNNSADDMFDLAQIVDRTGQYDQIWFFEYFDTTNGIANNARDLANLLNERDPGGASRLDLFGHSMGGLVARWSIEQEGLGENVQRLFTFGTPHKGVPSGVVGVLPFYIPGLPGLRDLNMSGEFIASLNLEDSPYKSRVLYCNFAGTRKEYLGPLGQVVRAIYDWLGYGIYPIDGIVARFSAIPDDMCRFGVSTAPNGSTTAVLFLNHSDIGGALPVLQPLREMMISNPGVGGG